MKLTVMGKRLIFFKTNISRDGTFGRMNKAENSQFGDNNYTYLRWCLDLLHQWQ